MPAESPAYVLPLFAAEWSRYVPRSDTERARYVAEELRRLVAEGGAILLAILQPGVDDHPRMLALEMLQTNAGPDGNPVIDASHLWRLRLKDGAAPPRLDPQGRPLSPAEAGKVLVAKVGVLGSERGRDQDTEGSIEWEGPSRARKAASGQSIYRLARVTSKPGAYTLPDAVKILQQWGVGVVARQYRRPTNWRPGEYFDGESEAARGQDQWLVEEVVDAKPVDVEGTEEPKRRKAAAA
jgi:hypothetical protein